jgi:UPF0755 protein
VALKSLAGVRGGVSVFLAALLVAAGTLALAAAWWVHSPLVPVGQAAVDVTIHNGDSAERAARRIVQAGVVTPPWLLHAWLRLSGEARQIKAGSYEIEPGTTPQHLLRKLVDGEQALLAVTIPEGWTFSQMRAALAAAPHLKPDTQRLSGADLMNLLGRAGVHPEGRFFPDTYRYGKHSSDEAVYRAALQAMDRQLAAAWAQRSPNLPLKSADEALTLASIVEKETGRDSDRGEIAGVFANRLRIGMRLQTDPTVIYGVGSGFDGNLTRAHLQTDTPYNTYTRGGLPPTPIALPGRASLMAAVQPSATAALYFVARGDGSSAFSATLAEHNRAVDRYQRRLQAGAER